MTDHRIGLDLFTDVLDVLVPDLDIVPRQLSFRAFSPMMEERSTATDFGSGGAIQFKAPTARCSPGG